MTLDLGGYLPDPQTDGVFAGVNKAVTLDTLESTPCLVLLGEPGMGKSTELTCEITRWQGSGQTTKAIDLGLFRDEERLLREAFESTDIESWKSGGETLHLFFDALDESQFNVPTFTKNLIHRLSTLPLDRLRLRVACRTADWPQVLDAGLRRAFGDEQYATFELLPLRRADVVLAAATHGVRDPDAFLRDVSANDLEPLAMRPLTLEMLLLTARGGALPRSRRALFERAALLLCQEHNEQYPREAKTLDQAQRCAVAARMAALSVLCGRPTFRRQPLAAADGASDLLSTDIVGATTEPHAGAGLAVSVAAVEETLRTALFTGVGAERIGWFHHSMAEYLAARWMAAHALTTEQVESLLFHPEEPTKVIPQLRGVVMWLTGMIPALAPRLAQLDPSVILGVDAPAIEPNVRALAVDALLRKLDELAAHDGESAIRVAATAG